MRHADVWACVALAILQPEIVVKAYYKAIVVHLRQHFAVGDFFHHSPFTRTRQLALKCGQVHSSRHKPASGLHLVTVFCKGCKVTQLEKFRLAQDQERERISRGMTSMRICVRSSQRLQNAPQLSARAACAHYQAPLERFLQAAVRLWVCPAPPRENATGVQSVPRACSVFKQVIQANCNRHVAGVPRERRLLASVGWRNVPCWRHALAHP